MQHNFIIRNHEDYLRVHITVLHHNPRGLVPETPPDKAAQTKSRKGAKQKESGQPAKLKLIPIR
jgi:hypothetical protein